VKVTPSNQTLILAGERGGPTARSAAGLDHTLTIASGDAVLQRVTIVAAHPNDTLVYVQADYAAANESAPRPGRSPIDASATDAVIASIGKSGTMALPAPQAPRSGPQTMSRGVGLYVSTQRILSDAPAAVHIDVHA
jgi:hypothetical protein